MRAMAASGVGLWSGVMTSRPNEAILMPEHREPTRSSKSD